jgi:hypothetical protein
MPVTDQSDLLKALGPTPDRATDVADLLSQIAKIASAVPDADWRLLPADLAANHDLYLYGARKVE